MDLSELIKNSFHDRLAWLSYFNLMNGLFEESRLETIHNAKTISVAVTCIALKETYGFTYSLMYPLVMEIFSTGRGTRLSYLIDTTSYDSFVNSIEHWNTTSFSMMRFDSWSQSKRSSHYIPS